MTDKYEYESPPIPAIAELEDCRKENARLRKKLKECDDIVWSERGGFEEREAFGERWGD